MSEENAIQPKKKPVQHNIALPGKRTALYTFARALMSFFMHVLFFLTCDGREKLNLDAPYLIIGNHTSMADPIIMAVLARRYEINFLGKRELADIPIIGKILLRLHMIPVDRHHSDMEAMRTCLKVTKAGGVLGIFPEGTRHKEGVMEHMESGVALIALRSGVPMIPMYIDGKPRLFRRMRVTVGDPIPMDDLRERGVNRETCQELLERITSVYRGMAKQKA